MKELFTVCLRRRHHHHRSRQSTIITGVEVRIPPHQLIQEHWWKKKKKKNRCCEFYTVSILFSLFLSLSLSISLPDLQLWWMVVALIMFWLLWLLLYYVRSLRWKKRKTRAELTCTERTESELNGKERVKCARANTVDGIKRCRGIQGTSWPEEERKAQMMMMMITAPRDQMKSARSRTDMMMVTYLGIYDRA